MPGWIVRFDSGLLDASPEMETLNGAANFADPVSKSLKVCKVKKMSGENRVREGGLKKRRRLAAGEADFRSSHWPLLEKIQAEGKVSKPAKVTAVDRAKSTGELSSGKLKAKKKRKRNLADGSENGVSEGKVTSTEKGMEEVRGGKEAAKKAKQLKPQGIVGDDPCSLVGTSSGSKVANFGGVEKLRQKYAPKAKKMPTALQHVNVADGGRDWEREEAMGKPHFQSIAREGRQKGAGREGVQAQAVKQEVVSESGRGLGMKKGRRHRRNQDRHGVEPIMRAKVLSKKIKIVNIRVSADRFEKQDAAHGTSWVEGKGSGDPKGIGQHYESAICLSPSLDSLNHTDSDIATASEPSLDGEQPAAARNTVLTMLDSDSEEGGTESCFGQRNGGVVADHTQPLESFGRSWTAKAPKPGAPLSSGRAERVLRYLWKRAVLLSPPMPTTHTPVGTGATRFTGHNSKAPRKTSVMSCSIMGSMVEVTLTNEAAVVDTWILANSGSSCGESLDPRRIGSGKAGAKSCTLEGFEGSVKARAQNSEAEVGQGPSGCRGLITEVRARADMILLGMDVEWRPNRWPGSDNKVALLQLSNGASCLLVQMLFLDSTPKYLGDLLQSPKVRLGGVGILEDARKLARDHGLPCEGQVADLNTMAAEQFRSEGLRNAGLKKLAEAVLGQTMAKNKKTTMSDWARRELHMEQVQYAAMDAWVSHAILTKLVEAANAAC